MIAARTGVGVLPVYIKTKKNKTGIFKKTRLIVGDYIKPSELDFDLPPREKYKKISRKIPCISLFEEGDAPEVWTPIKDK